MVPISDEEKEMLLGLMDDGISLKDISFKTGRAVETLRKLRTKYHPTTKLASRLIKASAEQLAERVIAKADVDQAIDILSRPNVGVLESAKGNNYGPQVMVSVGMDSLGGINPTIRIGGKDEGLQLPAWNEADGRNGADGDNGTTAEYRSADRPWDGDSRGSGRADRTTASGIPNAASAAEGHESPDASPEGGGHDTRNDGQNPPGRRRKPGVAKAAPKFVEDPKTKSRVAIQGKGKRSGINLRYDV